MSWFFIALVGPVLNAFANHLDKYILSKYLKGGEVGALIIFSALFSIFALPIILLFYPAVFAVSFFTGLVLAVNSMLVVFAILLYFYALNYDEATYVVPFYQTIPIFGFILGYFLLGETITQIQGAAALLIVLGGLVLSFELGRAHGKIRFKKEVVLLMLGASLLYAVNGVVFKLLAVDAGFWPSVFWGLVGNVILGVCFFLFVPSYRAQFLKLLKVNKFILLGLCSVSEALFIVAEAVTHYATLLASVALVLLVNAFQPIFVFILGVFLTLFFPKLGKESLNRTQLTQKIVGISFIIVGTVLLGV